MAHQKAGTCDVSARAVACSLLGSTTDTNCVPGFARTPSVLICPMRPHPTTQMPFLVSLDGVKSAEATAFGSGRDENVRWRSL